MKAFAHLALPVACAVLFLLWSLLLFQASPIVEALLVGSLVVATILSWFAVRATPLSGFSLSLAASIGFFLVWPLLWASAMEGYIFFCVPDGTTESGVGKSRYIYPGHSGMGHADGLIYYTKNLPGILIYGASVGLVSGLLLIAGRQLKRKFGAEQGAALDG